MDFFKAFCVDVRVYLSCADVGVSEHFLNQTQISAVSQQVSGEGVPQRVGADFFFYPRHESVFFYQLPNSFTS